MTDPERAGVSEADWAEATSSCFPMRVREVIQETRDARSIVLEVPDDLKPRFAYRAGQFLSFKIPFEGVVLTRSYSLSSSPDTDPLHKVTVKRVDDGRVSNWINDRVAAGDTLMVTPPAGLFVLTPDDRKLVFFAGGSGITPVVSLIKSALANTKRAAKLVYANRDADSIIFREELESIAAAHPGRLEVAHSLDAVDGYVHLQRAKAYVGSDLDADFYLCGPGIFMSTVEEALRELHVEHEHIHIERFISPPDPGPHPAEAPQPVNTEDGEDAAPDVITIVLDGETHEVPYTHGDKVIHALRDAGHEPPFSCEEGYCSCCMAKLVSGEVKMDTNDCLTPELLEEGWVLTCQTRCVRGHVRIEYPD